MIIILKYNNLWLKPVPMHPLQLRRFLDSNDYTITMITFQLHLM